MERIRRCQWRVMGSIPGDVNFYFGNYNQYFLDRVMWFIFHNIFNCLKYFTYGLVVRIRRCQWRVLGSIPGEGNLYFGNYNQYYYRVMWFIFHNIFTYCKVIPRWSSGKDSVFPPPWSGINSRCGNFYFRNFNQYLHRVMWFIFHNIFNCLQCFP